MSKLLEKLSNSMSRRAFFGTTMGVCTALVASMVGSRPVGAAGTVQIRCCRLCNNIKCNGNCPGSPWTWCCCTGGWTAFCTDCYPTTGTINGCGPTVICGEVYVEDIPCNGGAD